MKICEIHNEEMVLTGKNPPRLKCKSCNREYQKKWFSSNLEVQRERSLRNGKRATERNSAFILDYLLCHPCSDCGEQDIRVLEFDHVEEKLKSVSIMRRGYSLESVMEEIAKCEVVCANCHRIRTSERGEHWRSKI